MIIVQVHREDFMFWFATPDVDVCQQREMHMQCMHSRSCYFEKLVYQQRISHIMHNDKNQHYFFSFVHPGAKKGSVINAILTSDFYLIVNMNFTAYVEPREF